MVAFNAQPTPAGRGPSSRRWACTCSLDLAEHWLNLLAGSALAGQIEAWQVAEGVEHMLITVQREGAAA